MKRTNYFTLAALAVLSLAGCTQDDERAAGLPMTGMPLRVVAHVDAPVTREAMTTETLDHYYFLVTDQDGATTPEYDYFVEMTKGEDGQWTASKEMTWGTAYPKVSAIEQKGIDWIKDNYTGGGIVSVYADQNDRKCLLESDLLYMPPTNITAENLDADGNILVNLKHRFAKLNVVVNITGTTSNPITALTIGGTKTQAYFTPESNTLEAIGDATDITAYRESTEARTDAPGCTAIYECILIPQDVAAGTLEVTATLDEGSKSYTYDKALTLEGNCQYTLTLNMNHKGTLKPSDDINVGNWGDEEEIGEGGELEEGAEITTGPDGLTYTVSTAKGLLEWAKAVQDDDDLNLTLTEDIDMEGKTWPAIDDYRGTIDGGGHTIKNLTIAYQTNNCIGFIKEATNCKIKNLTLLNPSITSDRNGGFFIGGIATTCTIENCHVIGGTTGNNPNIGGLTFGATAGSSFTACSVTSSGASMIKQATYGNVSITACYVTGGKLVNVVNGTTTYNASYYQNGGDITSGNESTTATSWAEAATQMNTALSETSYKWIENTGSDKDDRPLIINPETIE